MPLYAPAPAAVAPDGETSCSCAACRHGHGRRRPPRPRRYTSDMTDAEWNIVEPLMPWPAWLDGNGGHPEEYCRRQVADAIGYLNRQRRQVAQPAR